MALSPLTESKWRPQIGILWGELTDELAAKHPKLQGTQELGSMVLEEWNQVRQEKIAAVIGSIP